MTSAGRISEREAEVLAALGAHLSNAQIANRLYISVRTVESHVSSLLRKYSVPDRAALAEVAGQVRAGASEPGRPAGLPVAGTTFVGRDDERNDVLAALSDARLVTLLGPGGVGKTRLAVAVAEESAAAFPSGGAFVDLVPVRDGFVARAVASTLGVTEGSHQPLDEAVAARLGAGRALLVLDNCEHVIEEAATFAERILAACPGTRVLVTSRERLGLPGERTVPVQPLPGPDAGRLFGDRALAADPEFAADPALVTELCTRLDGMPLAIELAAARSASLGVSGLLAALEDALRLLSGSRGGEARHRSLRAVIGWSYDLLDDEEKALFRRLGVFAGTFDVDAAAAIAGDRAGAADLLGRLVDKSLVVHRRGATSRWRLLATVRAFALAQLDDAGESADARARHLNWAADAATALEGRLGGDWRDEFDLIAGDLRGALAGAPESPDPTTHRLAAALAHLTYARRHLMESFAHYRTAAERATSPEDAARDLRAAAGCAHVSTTSNLQVYQLLLEAAGHCSGDARTIDLARAVETACRYPEAFDTDIPPERLRALLADAGTSDDPTVAAWLATANAWLAGPDTGLATAAAESARATGDVVLISAALCAVGTAAVNTGRLREANRITRERLALLPAMDRDDPHYAPEICNTFGRACVYAMMAGDLPGALAAARAGLADDLLSRTHITASRLIPPLVLTGELTEAVEHATRMWDEWERAGRPAPRWMQPAVAHTALANGLLGDTEALSLWQNRTAEVVGPDRPAVTTFVDAQLSLHNGHFNDAAAIVERALSAPPSDTYTAYALAAATELATRAKLSTVDTIRRRAQEAATENEWAAALLAR